MSCTRVGDQSELLRFTGYSMEFTFSFRKDCSRNLRFIDKNSSLGIIKQNSRSHGRCISPQRLKGEVRIVQEPYSLADYSLSRASVVGSGSTSRRQYDQEHGHACCGCFTTIWRLVQQVCVGSGWTEEMNIFISRSNYEIITAG